MPLTDQEREWLEKAQLAAEDPARSSEGLSVRIVIYILRQVVTLREEIASIKTRLEP
jgi:hypothetical protein